MLALASSPQCSVEPLLTLADICARYHVSDRRARDIVRPHGVPVLRPGRAFLFDSRAETAFREATRLNSSSSPTKAVSHAGTSRKPSRENDYEKALELVKTDSR